MFNYFETENGNIVCELTPAEFNIVELLLANDFNVKMLKNIYYDHLCDEIYGDCVLWGYVDVFVDDSYDKYGNTTLYYCVNENCPFNCEYLERNDL